MTQKAFSAVRWTTVSSIICSVLRLVQLAVLTRFLSAQDYGLMAIVAVILSYAALFSDMGLSTAYVQRQKISHEERSSLYWLSVVFSLVLMLLVMAASPLAALFFKEPQLISLTMLVSTNFIAVALGQQLRMDAEKALNFKRIALIEIISTTVGFCIAVLAAWLGWGVYALVVGAMSNAWLGMVLFWVLLANGWRPALRLRWGEVRWFVQFGGGLIINNVVNHINSTVDILLCGRLLGAELLGLYSVPRNLVLQVQFMVNPIFTRVGFPIIASIQHDILRVRSVYLVIMNFTASINAFIYIFASFFSNEIVQIFLDKKFLDSASLLQALAIWGLLRSFGNPVGSLLFGLGRVGLAVWWNIGLLLIIPPVLWYGSTYGAIGISWAMVCAMGALFVPGWVLLVKRSCQAGFWVYFKQVLMPSISAVIAVAIAQIIMIFFNAPLFRLIFGLLIGLILYFGVSLMLNREFFVLFFNIFKRNAPSMR